MFLAKRFIIPAGHHADPARDGETEDRSSRGVPEPGTAHSPSQPHPSQPHPTQRWLPLTCSAQPSRPCWERAGLQSVHESDDGTDESWQPGPAPGGEVRQSARPAGQYGLCGQTGQHSG